MSAEDLDLNADTDTDTYASGVSARDIHTCTNHDFLEITNTQLPTTTASSLPLLYQSPIPPHFDSTHKPFSSQVDLPAHTIQSFPKLILHTNQPPPNHTNASLAHKHHQCPIHEFPPTQIHILAGDRSPPTVDSSQNGVNTDASSHSQPDNQFLETASLSLTEAQLSYAHQNMMVQSADTCLKESPPVLITLSERFCTNVIDGSPTTDACVFQSGEDGNVHPDSKPLVAEECSVHLLGDQNKSEKRNNTIDVGPQVELAAGLSVLAENQIMTSHGSEDRVSQISRDEHTKNPLLEVLDSVSCTRGKWETGDGFNKDISLAVEPCSKSARTKEIEDASSSSLADHSHEKLADSLGEVYAERMQHVPHAEPVTGFDQMEITEKQVLCLDSLKPEISFEREYVASYTLAPEKEGEFFVSDLVWGKVKSHPWWPGQIFDASDASERAMKYKRKDKFLVAYFGDQTFAWNKASSLHHFRTHFSQMEKQGTSESFRIAVNYALDEVCRRVELGLVCSCTPKQVYAMVNSQVIENAGIREEARRMDGLGNSLRATFFESGKLLQFIKSLASYPCGGVDRLELKIAQAQLLAFYRLKGYCQLQEFHIFGGLLEDDVDNSCPDKKYHSHEIIKYETPVSHNNEHILYDKARLETLRSSRKRKYGSDGGLCPRRKKKRPSVGGKKGSSPLVSSGRHGVDERASSKSVPSSGVKQKAVDAFSESRTPQSFKVGECIRRIASQLTGSPPILKCSGERSQSDVSKLARGSASENDGVECSSCISEGTHQRRITLSIESSLDEMLSQLCLAAVDPKKEDGVLTTIVGFFSDFRDSISLRTGIGIRKPDTETSLFEFEEKKDSYWTDRIIQSSPEEQPSCRSGSKKEDSYSGILTGLDTSSAQVEDPLQLSLVLGFEGQNLDDDYVLLNEKPSRKYRKRKRKSQLVLSVDENTASDFELSCLGDHDVVTGNPLSRLNENKYVSKFSPTALSMSFTELDSIPSEMDLNKIFRRFGPLKESETKVLRDTKSATVVFKKQTDAEVAFSSAAKFSIFGPAHVSYQLRY